jgi:hypothetical protein
MGIIMDNRYLSNLFTARQNEFFVGRISDVGLLFTLPLSCLLLYTSS